MDTCIEVNARTDAIRPEQPWIEALQHGNVTQLTDGLVGYGDWKQLFMVEAKESTKYYLVK